MRDKNRRIVDEDHPDFEELIAWDRCVTYGKSVVSAPSHGKIFVEVHPKTQKLVCMILPRPRVFCHYGSLWTVMEPNYQAQKYHVDPESAKCWWYVDIDQFVDLCKKLIVDTAKDSHRVAKATGIKFVEFTKNWYRFRGADPFEVFIERIVSRRM
ncbi:MAG: hypothetical protein GY861_21025 [bacterium]|nr:hypothetical protein [bacterium]